MEKLGTKQYILGLLQKKKEIRTGDITKALGISRQTAAQHLQELAKSGKISRLGSTIDSRYVPYLDPSKLQPGQASKIEFRKPLKNLQEDSVFNQVAFTLKLKENLSEEAFRICAYAFSEMLNNAIDHSKAKTVLIQFQLTDGNAEFWIKDEGIGVFESIRKNFHFDDHYEAVEHLMKGKQTTDPVRHSGQGIFFTSRSADLFYIESAKIKWIVDNRLKDISIEENKKTIIGSGVYFCIKQKTRRDLKKIFDEYTNDDFEFDKTEVLVRLSKKQGEHVSRSEARRILFGLDKFKRIIFDFKDVPGIGQAFADEVFRVFQSQHPAITLARIHENPAVNFMIQRTLSELPDNRKK